MNKEMVKEVMNIEVKDNMEIDVMELVDYMNEVNKLNEKVEKVMLNGDKMVYVTNEELLNMSEVLVGIIGSDNIKKSVEEKKIEGDIIRVRKLEESINKYKNEWKGSSEEKKEKIEEKLVELESKIGEIGSIEELENKKEEERNKNIERVKGKIKEYIEIIVRRGGGNKEYWRNIKERVKDWNVEGIEKEINKMIEFSLEC